MQWIEVYVLVMYKQKVGAGYSRHYMWIYVRNNERGDQRYVQARKRYEGLGGALA